MTGKPDMSRETVKFKARANRILLGLIDGYPPLIVSDTYNECIASEGNILLFNI